MKTIVIVAGIVIAGAVTVAIVQDDKETHSDSHVQPTALPATTDSTGVSSALNPPHGQPGHRCDLPVGAPLNPSAQPSAPVNGPRQQESQAKTNPAHGLPGHRCDLPVGAPLT